MSLINWNIAAHPVNWLKIGLMAMLFMLAAELVCKAAAPATDPAPNIMP